MKMIIVMGLPGAGKTTVLKGLKTDHKIVNYGDMMFEIEKKEYGIKDRDEMRKLPIEKQRAAQKKVAEKLAAEKGGLILDTHCSVATPSGYYPGLPFEFLKGLKVDKLIYITTKPEDIIARRKSDQTRVRDVETVGDIVDHDNINRAFLSAYSAFTGAPAVIIYNKQGKLEEAVAKMQSVL